MYVKFNGIISGDNTSGDYISSIQIVWKAGAESEAAAIAASPSRSVTLTAGTDDAKIAAFRLSGGGVMLDAGSLVSGTTYTPAVKVTETRAGGTTSSSAWINGSTFTYTQLAAPTIGTATVSTKTLTWTAVTNSVGYKIYISTDSGNTYPTTVITGAVTSWVFTAMTASTYRYKVTAINTYGVESTFSSVATAA